MEGKVELVTGASTNFSLEGKVALIYRRIIASAYAECRYHLLQRYQAGAGRQGNRCIR